MGIGIKRHRKFRVSAQYVPSLLHRRLDFQMLEEIRLLSLGSDGTKRRLGEPDSPTNTTVRPDDYFYSLKFFLTETEINASRRAPYYLRTKDNLRCTLLFNRGIPILLSMIKLTTSTTKFITSVLEVCPPRSFICIVYIMTARIQKDLFFLNSLLTNLTSLQLNLSLVDSDTHD